MCGCPLVLLGRQIIAQHSPILVLAAHAANDLTAHIADVTDGGPLRVEGWLLSPELAAACVHAAHVHAQAPS